MGVVRRRDGRQLTRTTRVVTYPAPTSGASVSTRTVRCRATPLIPVVPRGRREGPCTEEGPGPRARGVTATYRTRTTSDYIMDPTLLSRVHSDGQRIGLHSLDCPLTTRVGNRPVLSCYIRSLNLQCSVTFSVTSGKPRLETVDSVRPGILLGLFRVTGL